MVANEAFSRVRIDAQLRDAGWTVADGRSIRFEYPLSDGTRADYVLCDEQGRPLAVLEAKRASASLGAAEPQNSPLRRLRIHRQQARLHPHLRSTLFRV